MLFSVAADATLTYHPVVLPVPIYWIGCPISPEFLSDTLLTTLSNPPFPLILSSLSFNASFKVFASLILVFVVIPDAETVITL